MVDAADDPPHLIFSPIGDRFVEVGPVKEQLRAVDRLGRGLVDAVDVELPVAGENRSGEGDLVADSGARSAPRAQRVSCWTWP